MVRGLELEKLGSMFSSLNAMHVKITGQEGGGRKVSPRKSVVQSDLT